MLPKNPLKEKQWFFLTGACECKRSFGAKISQPLISIQPHLLLCLVVTWLLMCDWQALASVLIGAGFYFIYLFLFRVAKHMADGQVWAVCGMRRYFCLAPDHTRPYQSSILCRPHLGGSQFKVSVETATLRGRIVKLFAITQCDGIGWPAVASSTGLCFARLLGCLSYLPV